MYSTSQTFDRKAETGNATHHVPDRNNVAFFFGVEINEIGPPAIVVSLVSVWTVLCKVSLLSTTEALVIFLSGLGSLCNIAPGVVVWVGTLSPPVVGCTVSA